MKVKYFSDTDTMYVEISSGVVAETKELNKNLFIDVDKDGKVLSLTIEHAKENSGQLDFSYENIAA
jgi:uncharacterized protein YuzE